MKITPDELVTLLGRIREEERHRTSSILAEMEQDLIRKIGKFREEVKSTWDETLEKRTQVLSMLDSLDPCQGQESVLETVRKRYPTMFKGGPT